MPAYFTLGVSFKKDILYKNFVKDIYEIFFQHRFKFKSGFWFDKDISLKEIVDWNQKHLQNKFVLRHSQHVKHGYKQILLETDMYYEMRSYWMYLYNRIKLNLIIPEFDVLHTELKRTFKEEKVAPLIDMSKTIWNTGLVEIVESYLELDDGLTSISQIKRGHLPCIKPFCILDENLSRKFISAIDNKVVCQQLDNSGVLIIDTTLVNS